MPSAETVEIDAANNDVAILDASDCALAGAGGASSLVYGFATLNDNSSSSSSNTVTQYSQESDMIAVAESVHAAKDGVGANDNDDDRNEEGEEKDSKSSSSTGRQVSPMPQKRGAATIVTPRSLRKAPTAATTAPAKASASAKGKGGKSSSASSASTKAEKSTAAKGVAAVDGNANSSVDSTTPTTPSSASSSHPSTSASSTSSTRVAIATPGGDESAIKKKKTVAVAAIPKKPTTTLHSFFRKVDPSDAKKKKITTVEVKKNKPAEVKKAVETSNVVVEKKKEVVVGSGSSSSDVGSDKDKAKEPTSNKGEVEVTVVEKSGTLAPKETTAGIPKVSTKKVKATAKNQEGSAQPPGTKDSSSAVVVAVDASSLSTSDRKPVAKKTHQKKEEENDLDDSPAFALAAALRMVNNKRSGKSRRSGGVVGGREHTEVVIASKIEKNATNILISTEERKTEPSPSGKFAACSQEKKDESSSIDPDAVVENGDALSNVGNTTMDVDECKNVQDTTLVDTSNTVAADELDIAPTCEIEEKSADNADTNDVTEEEVAVDVSQLEGASSPVSVEEPEIALASGSEENPADNADIVQQQQPVCDLTNEKKEVATRADDDLVNTADAIKESCADMPSDNTTKQVSSDDIKVVDELKAMNSTQSKATGTKSKSSTKATMVVSVKNGQSSILSSLKKLASCTPKTSVAAPMTTLASASTTPEALSVATSDSASTSDSAPSGSTDNLSEEDATRLHHYLTLRVKYAGRAAELGKLPSAETFEEENLRFDDTLEKASVEITDDGCFPDKLLMQLQMMTQGSPQPLSELSKRALDELSPYIADAKPLTLESISSKIKLLAQRKSYLSRLPPGTFEKPSPTSKLDCFENAEECYMWRWELCSLDLLPQPESMKVKKARTMRKKLQSHYKAIINLITATDKAILWLQGCATTKASSVGATLTAKVSEMEEKVLKFEREEEKIRLAKEAEAQKQKIKAEELAEKQLEKERIEEEKRNEKKRLEEEKLNEKKRKDEEREQKKAEANRIKNEEKEKKKQEIEEKENKRKARMMMFFSNGSATKKAKVSSPQKSSIQGEISSFDSDAFRKLINSQGDHVGTFTFAKVPRRRTMAKVRVSVFVTVLSENAFAPQPYDEERVIVVPNRYKFLGFHEDVRPPYRGTWSKRSSFVTGRRPLGKDTKYLDYDIDSEEEWEEGDDEDGEDLIDGDDGADEEEDMLNEDDNDGWLAAEDDLGIEDDDDETRELRKKSLYDNVNSLSGKRNNFKACVVAPCRGGLPHTTFEGGNFIEGFNPEDAMEVLNSHLGYIITPDVSICLDAFPPSDTIKDTNQPNNLSAKSPSSQNKEMTLEAQKIMAVFIHNSTLKSRDTLVTELLKLHPSLASSRAHAVRELDVIATKRRLTNGLGVVWEVKAEHLNKLELNEKDLKQPPNEDLSPTSPVEEGKTKKMKDPNAPKRNASAYLLYSIVARNDVRNANPNAMVADINKILSDNFKALSPEDRAVWDLKAAADKERYSKEMAQYITGTAGSDNAVAAGTVEAQPAVAETVVSESPPKSLQVLATGTNQLSTKKRKTPVVSKASADLLAKFMKKKQKVTPAPSESGTQQNTTSAQPGNES